MNKQTEGGHSARHDRFVEEYKHDSYKMPGKLKEPTVCTVRRPLPKGRWTWEAKPADAEPITCPACLRIQDKNPKGFVTLKRDLHDPASRSGDGADSQYRGAGKSSTPWLASWRSKTGPRGWSSSATPIAPAHRQRLKHAHHGELDIRDQDEEFVRITWTS
ncbi:MAG: ATPase [Nitrospira sp.]|nr:ATPase [Nitrospira sp.]